MIKEVTATGKDILEAQENARAALGADVLDDVKFEILHAGSKGIFGIIGVKPAQVRAYIELPDAKEKRRERPKKERREESADAPRRENKNHANNNKKKGDKKQRSAGEQKDQKQRSEVIPEESLKMERREVAAGEDMSFDFIKTVISDIGLSAEAELYACEDGTRRIAIVGEDASALIGHHGDTLDALQYLANLASAKKNANGERDKSRVTLDIEGYRAKREATLRALARRMGAKALKNRRSIMLEPMSAYERRIIHSEIQKMEGISTNSIGSDNNRKIVIFLTDKKPKELFEEKESVSALADEMIADVDDNSGAVDAVVTSDIAEDGETSAFEQTYSAEDYVVSGENSDN
jgi:spoIIIJ-associated protein